MNIFVQLLVLLILAISSLSCSERNDRKKIQGLLKDAIIGHYNIPVDSDQQLEESGFSGNLDKEPVILLGKYHVEFDRVRTSHSM